MFNTNLFGFDFSKWNGVIDFSKVKGYGAKFIILRCSYGIMKDQRIEEYFPEAVKYFNGKLSVYHYFEPAVSPEAQHTTILSVVDKNKEFIKRVWIDLEFTNTGAYSNPIHWKKLGELLLSSGYNIGFYTRASWWDTKVGNLASWFGTFPLWAAQYNSSLTMIPTGWDKASLWQTGTPSIGRHVGTESLEVDYNLADDSFYYSEYGEIPEENQQGAKNMLTYKVLVSGLWLRKQPLISSETTLFVMPMGTLVWGIKNGDWINVSYVKLPTDAQPVEVQGYCSGNAAYIAQVDFINPTSQSGEKIVEITIKLDGYQPQTVTATLIPESL